MKIEYRFGDVLGTEITHIVHGCNAQGVFNAGIAKQIRAQFPEAYLHYRDIYNSATDKGLSSLPLGEIYTAESNGKKILNAITQKNYGNNINIRYVSYDAVDSIMKRIDAMGISIVAMPQIGSGLGGGDWQVIAAIIESRLTRVQPVVYIL
jgi:O-acetyl-ADP-ribose deacetylase (regulator of RNase III)